MKKLIALMVLAGCGAMPAVEGVEAADGALLVRGHGIDGLRWVVEQNGARFESVDETQLPGAVVLSVPGLRRGIGGTATALGTPLSSVPLSTSAGAELRAAVSAYGSTYNSNCTCSYCSKWCSTKSGGVVYSGTCC